jgi:hypothetical protein
MFDIMEAKKTRPGQSGVLVATRVQPGLLKKLDAWRREQEDLPSRPEALRRLAEKALAQP